MRFIPAGAGNTKLDITECSRVAVYPRWRGEHSVAATPVVPLPGLSPLARGTRKLRRPAPAARRFIPAGAGNTNKALTGDITLTVYPRWRGEHYRKESANGDRGGLSPLARGTLTVAPLRVGDGRFIPAGAGNTTNRDLSAVSLPVYPRWRGEHIIRKSIYILSVGLSPLARGTH